MDVTVGLRYGPLKSLPQALLYFFNQILPACKPIFARQHQLGITLGQRQFGFREVSTRPADGFWIASNDATRQFLGLLAQGIKGRTSGKL